MAKSNKKQTEETKAEEASDTAEESEDDEAEAAEDEFIAPVVSNAKVNAKVLQSLTDLVEYYVEMTIVDRRDRLENAQAANYYWRLHPAKSICFGRLFLRARIAVILGDVCPLPPFGVEDESEKKEIDDLPMVRWDRDRWDFLKKDLEVCKEHILRKDATMVLTGDADEAKSAQDNRKDPGRSISQLFKKKLDKILRFIEINKAIAPVRASLRKQIEEKKEGKPQITQAELKELLEYVEKMKTEDKEPVQQLFDEELFEGGTEESAKKSAGKKKRRASLGFVHINQLATYLNEKPFGLAYIQDKIVRLLQKWNSEVFGPDDPTLIQLHYGIPKGSEITALLSTPKPIRRSSTTERRQSRSKSATQYTGDVDVDDRSRASNHGDAKRPARTQAELEELRRDLAALNTKHGVNPLAGSLAVATGAQGAARKRTYDEVEDDKDGDNERGGKLLEKKRTATLRAFEDDDDDDEEGQNLKLSALPGSAKKSPAYEPDNGVFTATGKVKRRRPWTEEETLAVTEGFKRHKEGVKRHGRRGKWAEIKADHEYILRNRTSVQIKDKYYTMDQNNKL